jgi:hypothetical protein
MKIVRATWQHQGHAIARAHAKTLQTASHPQRCLPKISVGYRLGGSAVAIPFDRDAFGLALQMPLQRFQQGLSGAGGGRLERFGRRHAAWKHWLLRVGSDNKSQQGTRRFRQQGLLRQAHAEALL